MRRRRVGEGRRTGEGSEGGSLIFLIKEGPTYSKISAGVGEQGKISPYSYFRRLSDQVDISFVLFFVEKYNQFVAVICFTTMAPVRVDKPSVKYKSH